MIGLGKGGKQEMEFVQVQPAQLTLYRHMALSLGLTIC